MTLNFKIQRGTRSSWIFQKWTASSLPDNTSAQHHWCCGNNSKGELVTQQNRCLYFKSSNGKSRTAHTEPLLKTVNQLKLVYNYVEFKIIEVLVQTIQKSVTLLF